MNANKLALAFGMLAFASGCTATTTPSTQKQASQVTAVTSEAVTGTIKIDGSSTVYPITQAIAKQFQQTNNSQVQVNFSGTSGGFEKFCAGETDINDASRPINQEEMAVCNKNGIRYIELPIAFDALTIAVNHENNWAKDITIEELKKIWEPGAERKITRWNQARASWPDRPLNLYGAGKKSGTFDYFTEAIVGQAKASRNDYTASEDDEVLVNGISQDANALGYFGFAYYEENQNKLKALAVNNGKETVLPSRQAVEKARYQPLSRPLFIYLNPWDAKNKQALNKFVTFYIQKVPTTASSVGYVPLPAEAYHIDNVHLNTGKAGTVFAGKAQIDLTLAELLRRQKQF